MKRRVIAADEEKDTRFDDAVSNLKDDFNFALEGLDKLARSNRIDEALRHIVNLQDSINETILDVSESVIKED